MSVFTKLSKQVRTLRMRYKNWRRGRKTLPPYVLISLSSEVVQFPHPSPFEHIPFIDRLPLPIPDSPWSVSELRRVFESLSLDPRIKGVVLEMELSADPSIYQSLYKAISDFRATGKRVIAYASAFGPFQYYLASACDEIIMPPSAEWMVLGFQNEYVFLKDALDEIGVGFDVVRVSPFKSAGDQFVRNDFSEDARAQAEWLLDARFDELVRGIAAGRKLSVERVRELINSAPFGARDAVIHGLIDAALYEDELERHLVPEPVGDLTDNKDRGWRERLFKRLMARLPPQVQSQVKEMLDEGKNSAIGLYDDIEGTLLIPQFEYEDKLIGVVKIEGTIMPGNSFNSPLPVPILGERMAGAHTIAQMIRRAEKDDQLAAVILYVDSPGGSALASDLIAREVRRLKAKKPVIAYMGGVAASGGYYVSALAHSIIAQPLTMTGSIGVISLKPNTQRTFGKLKLNRVLLKRGEHAGLMSDATPLNSDERQVLERLIVRTYGEFKNIVAEGRNIEHDALEPLCGGRVWTGEMALARQLVDALGDITVAIDKARELAGLKSNKRVRTVILTPPRKFVLPMAFVANPASALLDGWQRMRDLFLTHRAWALSEWMSEKTR